jgi:hypothetical protein
MEEACSSEMLVIIYNSRSQPVVRIPMGVRKNNIGNGGKNTKKKELELKHKNKVMKFWFTKRFTFLLVI